MSGVGDLISLSIPQILSTMSIATPAKTLSTVRVAGSNDATYGSIGWVPPQDQSAFAYVQVQGFSVGRQETNRNWVTYQVPIFIAVAHGDTPFVVENFNNEAGQWAEAAIQTIASNMRVLPTGGAISNISGDVRWELDRGGIREKHPIYSIPYYGVQLDTSLRIVYAVNYQG